MLVSSKAFFMRLKRRIKRDNNDLLFTLALCKNFCSAPIGVKKQGARHERVPTKFAKNMVVK
jgi:hypothetical protein